MSLSSRTPENSQSPSKGDKKDPDSSSLYHVGSDALDQDPHGFAHVVNTVDEEHTPSEVTRLLNGSGDSPKKSKEKDASKKKLFSWLVKFGVISCVLVALVAGIAVLAVYLSNHRGNTLEGCVNEELYDIQFDYFPEKLTDFASGLEVVYYNHYKTVRIRNGQRYVLYQCGTPVPTGYTSSRYFSVPVVATATNFQTPINFVEV